MKRKARLYPERLLNYCNYRRDANPGSHCFQCYQVHVGKKERYRRNIGKYSKEKIEKLLKPAQVDHMHVEEKK